MDRRQKILLSIAVIALLIGGMVYVIDRPVGSAYLLPSWLVIFERPIGLYGTVGSYLPSFIHIYAFILLTAACLLPTRMQMVFICFVWLIIELLFEIAQYDTVAHWITAGIANRFEGVMFLEYVSRYCIAGVFDGWDVFAVVIGACAAYFTLSLVGIRRRVEME